MTTSRKHQLILTDQEIHKIWERVLDDSLSTHFSPELLSPLALNDFGSFWLSLKSESDRALSIVAFSYIDDKVGSIMTLAMNPELPGGIKSLFEQSGPLSSASSRLRLAAALNWLTKPTFDSLQHMRKIRNVFAHSPLVSNFNVQSVSDHVSAMHDFESAIWKLRTDEMIPIDELSFRQLFHIRAVITCSRLIVELLTAPFILRWGYSGKWAPGRPFDKLPDPLKQVTRDGLNTALLLGQRPDYQDPESDVSK